MNSILDSLSNFSSLASTLGRPGAIEGARVFVVPANINTIFLGPDAWVQGKRVFE